MIDLRNRHSALFLMSTDIGRMLDHIAIALVTQDMMCGVNLEFLHCMMSTNIITIHIVLMLHKAFLIHSPGIWSHKCWFAGP